MATNVQRATAIANALINGTATAQQMESVAKAVHLQVNGMTSDPAWDTFTPQQKAASFIVGVRHYIKTCMVAAKKTALENQAQQDAENEIPEAP